MPDSVCRLGRLKIFSKTLWKVGNQFEVEDKNGWSEDSQTQAKSLNTISWANEKVLWQYFETNTGVSTL